MHMYCRCRNLWNTYTSFLCLLVISLSLLSCCSISSQAQTPNSSTSTNKKYSSALQARHVHLVEQSLRARLNANDSTSPLIETDIAQLRVKSYYVSKHNGVAHLVLQQQYKGIDVHQGLLEAHIHEGEIVAWHDHLAPQLEKRIQNAASGQPSLSAKAALESAIDQLRREHHDAIAPFQAGKITTISKSNTAERKSVFDAPHLSSSKIPVELVYQAAADRSLQLAWDLHLSTTDGAHWYTLRVDVESGELMELGDWAVHCSFGDAAHDHSQCGGSHAHKNSSKNSAAADWFSASAKEVLFPMVGTSAAAPPGIYTYNVFPFPLESPEDGEQQIITEPWLVAGDAGTLGWHENGSNIFNYLRGNNVWTVEDQDNNNTGGYSSSGFVLQYDFPFDPTKEPEDNLDAGLTNLFYSCNVLHDIFYQYGFDEAAGNFQDNNLGRGGAGDDYLYADALDGSGINNATFATPADGESPRMQMFKWLSGSFVSNQVTITAPASMAGDTYLASGANFGAAIPDDPDAITGVLALVDDGTELPTQACDTLVNPSEIAGKIAVVDRGECLFVDKALYAQNAGAIAVMVCNNVSGNPFNMGGSNELVTIPAFMLSQSDCEIIKTEIGNDMSISVSVSDIGDPDRDSGMDNTIVAHEFGHGISSRLTGGPDNASCLFNEEQMGEGWSDYFGLILTMDESDLGTDARGIGVYSDFDETGAGIRPTAYSTDMAVNGSTYDDLCNSDIVVPHGVGYIWSTMLWEMTWGLIDEYGFDSDLYYGTGGNNLALQLVMDGLTLQPCSPGFADGRDAILLADEINNGGKNSCIIWEAFAKRGMGFSADQGSSNSRCDGTAAFDMPPICQEILYMEETLEQNEIAISDTLSIDLWSTNRTGSTLANARFEAQLSSPMNYVDASSACAETATASDVSLGGVSFPSIDTMTCAYELGFEPNIYSSLWYQDGMEDGVSDWTVETFLGPAGAGWYVNTDKTHTGANAWFAPNVEGSSDQYIITKEIGPVSSDLELHFWHYYNTEPTWDGGVVEISLDGGTIWADAGPLMTAHPYNSTIQVNPASPISGKAAFSGDSKGFVKSVVGLAPYAGQNIRIRFRLGTDEFVSAEGWYIDDVRFVEPVTTNTDVCVTSDAGVDYCDSHEILLLPSACATRAEALSLSSSPSDFSTSFCQGEAINWTFSHQQTDSSYPPNPITFPYVYVLTEDNDPAYTILAYNETGEFSAADLAPGTYTFWGVSYDFSNKQSAADYFASITDLQTLMQAVDNGDICAAWTNTSIDGNSYQWIVKDGVELQMTAILGGAYDTGTGQMKTTLFDNDLIPTAQPYGDAPWGYMGTESASSIPNNVIDWVLVELRSEIDSSLITAQAAFLHVDGTILDTAGNPGLYFEGSGCDQNFFVALRHRNHLDVMSATAYDLSNGAAVDFTDPAQIMGVDQLIAKGDTYGLRPGDFTGEGIITTLDLNLYLSQSSELNTYIVGDANMDKNVTVFDYNHFIENLSVIGVNVLRY